MYSLDDMYIFTKYAAHAKQSNVKLMIAVGFISYTVAHHL